MKLSQKWISALELMSALGHTKRCYRALAPRCGARRKSDGEACQARALDNGRCRFHGGLSTGPRTEEGRRRALMNLRQFRAAGKLPP